MTEHWTTTHGDSVTVYQAADGQWHWRVQAPNGEVVGQGEGHPRFTDAEEAALRHHPKAEP